MNEYSIYIIFRVKCKYLSFQWFESKLDVDNKRKRHTKPNQSDKYSDLIARSFLFCYSVYGTRVSIEWLYASFSGVRFQCIRRSLWILLLLVFLRKALVDSKSLMESGSRVRIFAIGSCILPPFAPFPYHDRPHCRNSLALGFKRTEFKASAAQFHWIRFGSMAFSIASLCSSIFSSFPSAYSSSACFIPKNGVK